MKSNILLAALAAACALSPALAEPTGAPPEARAVSYEDLDLSRDSDVRMLDRRIRTAIESACGPTSAADPAGANDVRRCRAETRDRIAAQRARAIASARPAWRSASAEPAVSPSSR